MNSLRQHAPTDAKYKWIPETDTMLNAESRFIRDIQSVRGFNWNYEKLPIAYKLDWAICEGNIIRGFAELKIRTNSRNDYPTLMLSMAKYRELLEVTMNFKPAVLFVRWKDQDCIHKPQDYDHTLYELKVDGRLDRKRIGDIEPCIHIPVNHFATIRHTQ